MTFKDQLNLGFRKLGEIVVSQYRHHKPGSDEDIAARVVVPGPHGIRYWLTFRRQFKGPWVANITNALAEVNRDITPVAQIKELAGEFNLGNTRHIVTTFATDTGEIIGQQEAAAQRKRQRVSYRHGKPVGFRERLHR